MLSAHVHAGAGRCADHDRATCLAAKHVAEFSRLIEDLIEADTKEVREHEFCDRTQTCERGTVGGADDGGFGYGRVNDPIFTKLG
jgi:hypothetical protein